MGQPLGSQAKLQVLDRGSRILVAGFAGRASETGQDRNVWAAERRMVSWQGLRIGDVQAGFGDLAVAERPVPGLRASIRPYDDIPRAILTSVGVLFVQNSIALCPRPIE